MGRADQGVRRKCRLMDGWEGSSINVRCGSVASIWPRTDDFRHPPINGHRYRASVPSADQVPVNSTHSTMRWHKWVVLIAGSTGSALRAVRPPNLHITPVARRDLAYRASAAGCL